MPTMFLAYHDPVDGTKYAELETANDPIFFLPAEVNDEIELTTTVPARRNDYTQLELQCSIVWLSVWGREACHLLYGGHEIPIPPSTTFNRYTILLRDGDQFSNETGRWSIERDDEQGTIQNSMRPPPCPCPPRPNLEEITPDEAPPFDGDLDLDPPQNDDGAMVDNFLDFGEAENIEIDPNPAIGGARSDEEVSIGSAQSGEKAKTADSPSSGVPESVSEDLGQDHERIGQCFSGGIDAPNGPPKVAHHKSISTPGDCKPQKNIPKDNTSELNTQHDRESSSTSSHLSPEKHTIGDVGAGGTFEVRGGKCKESEVFERGAKRRKVSEKGIQTVEGHDRDPGEETIVVAPIIPQLELENTMVAAFSKKRKTDTVSPSRDQSTIDSPKKQPKRRGRPKKRIAKTVSVNETFNAEHDDSPQPTGNPADNSNSGRSRRSISTPEWTNFEGSPVVFFASNTNIDRNKKTMKTFHDLGGRKANSIGEASIYCVGDAPLKKTGSLLLAITQGADIVTEKWIIETHKQKGFPGVSKFMPHDRGNERQWGFRLSEAIQRGKSGLAHLLRGTTVYMTDQLNKVFGDSRVQDICTVAIALGADGVKGQLPKTGKKPSSAIVIGCADDAEGAHVARLGLKMFDKELLTMAVLRGVINLEGDNFELETPIKDESSQ